MRDEVTERPAEPYFTPSPLPVWKPWLLQWAASEVVSAREWEAQTDFLLDHGPAYVSGSAEYASEHWLHAVRYLLTYLLSEDR